MNDNFFLDTNLFIYQLEFLDKRKARIAEDIITQGIAEGNAYISFQIIQECLNTIQRKAEIPLRLKLFVIWKLFFAPYGRSCPVVTFMYMHSKYSGAIFMGSMTLW